MAKIAKISTPERDVRQRALTENAGEFAANVTDDAPLIGFVVMAFYGDGTTMAVSSRPSPDEHRIGSTMFDAWARQTLEDQLQYVQQVDTVEQVLGE